jgi:P-type E1-E2 ATPase
VCVYGSVSSSVQRTSVMQCESILSKRLMHCIPCLQVVGDIVRLNAGDRVPSDGVIVECSDLTCNESALTGESEDRVTICPHTQHA